MLLEVVKMADSFVVRTCSANERGCNNVLYGYIRTLNPLKVSFELISHGEGQQKSKTLAMLKFSVLCI